MANAVKLKSLRVVADYDAKGYSAGAAEKVAADLRMVRSGDQLGASLASADQKLVNAIPGMAKLSRAYIEGYSSAEKFERALRQIDNALDRGMGTDRAMAMINGLERTFGRAASSADLFKAKLFGVGQVVENAHFVRRVEAATGLNMGPAKSAQESASVFEAAAASETERMAKAAASLRAEIDPLAAAQDRLNSELAEYRTLATTGAITTQELELAQELANRRFLQVSDSLRRAGTSAGLNRMEMANLSYQFNDIAVMLASGQSPFIMMMQQGMQIGQIIGPQGLQAGVRSLGIGILQFLSNPVNLAVVGFAALASGAAYAFQNMKSELPKISDLLETQQSLLSDLREAYRDIGREVGNMSAGNVRVLEFRARLNIEDSKRRIDADLETLTRDIMPGYRSIGKGGYITVNPENMPFKSAIEGLQEALRTGKGDITRFRDDMAAIAAGNADEKVRKTAKTIFDLTNEVEKFQRQTDALSLSLDPLASKLSKLYSSPRAFLGEEPKTKDLYSFLPDVTPKEVQLQKSYDSFLKTSGGDLSLIAEANRVVTETQRYWNAELAKSVRLADLEVKSIYVRTPAQKAAIAAERERLEALNTSMSAEEINQRVQAASVLAFKQATFAITEQNRARLQAANDNIKTAQLEVQLVGASNAERALATANLQTYIDLQKQAIQNGLAFDQAQYELLVKKNAEAARFVEILAVQKSYEELDREKRFSGMNPRAVDIERKMLASGVSEGTQAYEDLKQAYKDIADSQRTFSYGAKQAFFEVYNEVTDYSATMKDFFTGLYQEGENVWTNFAKTGKLSLDSLQDYLISALAKMSYQFAVSGIMQMFEHPLYGGAGGGIGGLLGSLFSANGNAFAGGNVIRYARGGTFTNSIVNRPTMFGYGGKFGVMGEAGPEAIMPLSRGRDGKLGVAASGGRVSIQVQNTVVNNAPGVEARTETRNDGLGGIELVTFIEETAIRAVTSGKGATALQATYGINKTRTRR